MAIEFLPYVKTALYEVERDLDQIATIDPAGMDGTLTIGIDQYSLLILGVSLVSYLRAAAPNLSISLVSAPPHECEDELIKGKFDFVIGKVWLPTPQITQDILFTESFVGLARTDHPLTSTDETVSIDDYLSFPHVLFSEVGRVRRNVDHALTQIGRTREVNLTTPSLTLAAEYVEKSDKITNLGKNMARHVKPSLYSWLFRLGLLTLQL